MKMTTNRLLLLRLYNITLGRTAVGARVLRLALQHVLISRKAASQRYVASSRFFGIDELED